MNTSRTTECPRCGYDLSGTVAAWNASCPMLGTCTECGLEFEWSEVLNPIFRVPTWFLEHPYRRVWRTFMPTYARCLRPKRFWSTLRMSFPVMPWRLAQFAAEMAVAFHLMLGYLVVSTLYGAGWPIGLLEKPIDEWIENVLRLLVFPYRTWFVETAPIVGVPPGFSFGQDVPTPFDASVLFLVLMFFLTPMQFVLLRQSMRIGKVRAVHLARVAAYSLVPLPWALTGYMLLKMSDSWKWSLFRGQLYQIGNVLGRCTQTIESVAPIWVVLIGGGFAWLSWYWSCAIRTYLRLPHSIGVALSISVIAALLSSLIVLLLLVSGSIEGSLA